MKISIFTPTNNPQWFDFPYNSIKSQLELDPTLDVEWIIVPNSNAEIPKKVSNESWVKVIRCPNTLKNIGALKRFACELATGDAFLELDHDDELMPGSLRYIVDALKDKPNAFLYSYTCTHRKDGKSPLYSKYWGWEHTEWEGHPVNKTFDPMPRSLCEIFFSPDHVRVWTREAYKASGGHDSELFVGDDHDLIIRTYLAGCEFVKVERPLYKYFIHGNNSWLQNCDAVQKQQAANRDKYLRDLVKEWCRRENLPIVNFPSKEYNDAAPNSIGCIIANDTLASLPAGTSVQFMNEAYEKLAVAGWLLINVPSTDGKGAWCDPTHTSFWNDLSFRYYTNAQFSKFIPAVKCRFQQVVLKNEKPTKWHEENNVPYVRSDMCALKGQRQPGASLI